MIKLLLASELSKSIIKNPYLAWKVNKKIIGFNIDSKYFIGSIINASKNKFWYKNGVLHRLDGPAVEYSNGYKVWYQEGKEHRDDGPAVELSNGTKIWYQEGNLHRIDDPAVEYSNGTKSWYKNGIRHLKEQLY